MPTSAPHPFGAAAKRPSQQEPTRFAIAGVARSSGRAFALVWRTHRGLTLALAALSNVGQGLEAAFFPRSGFNFGGMSGVGYGIFGYLLIKVRFGNKEQYLLSPTTVVIGLVWFVLCLARSFPETSGMLSFIPPIANSAHTVGLFAGMAIAYAPFLSPRRAE